MMTWKQYLAHEKKAVHKMRQAYFAKVFAQHGTYQDVAKAIGIDRTSIYDRTAGMDLTLGKRHIKTLRRWMTEGELSDYREMRKADIPVVECLEAVGRADLAAEVAA